MKIGEKKFVGLNYTLRVGGEVVDRSPEDQPLRFVFGMGMLLPGFEENIEGRKTGDKFAFTLTPEQGYGVEDEEAVVALPRTAFMVDGKVEEGLLETGNRIPMATAEGQRMIGVVKAVDGDTVTMDFNHPMAGKTLDFSGDIVEVRDSTDADLAPFAGGGCGCGSDCGGDGCDDGGCGCGCH